MLSWYPTRLSDPNNPWLHHTVFHIPRLSAIPCESPLNAGVYQDRIGSPGGALDERLSQFPPFVFWLLSLDAGLGDTKLQNQSGSQSAFDAMGGYSWPSLSTRGSQVHHSLLAIGVMTVAMWDPQPHQEALSARSWSCQLNSQGENNWKRSGLYFDKRGTHCRLNMFPFCTLSLNIVVGRVESD